MTHDPLRRLWDFDDLDGTETRLRAALDQVAVDEERAELLTQLARVASLRGNYEAAHALVDQADDLAGASGRARLRIVLERGRILRRAGAAKDALPLFEHAYEAASAEGDDFLAADAAHMCALAGDTILWTRRGLELAARSEAAAPWRRTLLVNLGRWQWEHGRRAEALASFRAALDEPDHEDSYAFIREYARFGVGRALRALGRTEDAVPFLEGAVAWATAADFNGREAAEFGAELAAARAEVGGPDLRRAPT